MIANRTELDRTSRHSLVLLLPVAEIVFAHISEVTVDLGQSVPIQFTHIIQILDIVRQKNVNRIVIVVSGNSTLRSLTIPQFPWVKLYTCQKSVHSAAQ
jgi:hypothetical protein